MAHPVIRSLLKNLVLFLTLVIVGGWAGTSLAFQFIGGQAVASDTNLISNGDFADWTGDDPDEWTITSEDGDDSYIDESGGGGAARFVYAAGDDSLSLSQSVLSSGVTYDYSIEIVTDTAGYLKLGGNTGTGYGTTINGVGTHSGSFTADGTDFSISRGSGAISTDMVLDNISVTPQ